MADAREVDVLIVGGGGAGLAAALMLGDLDVDFLLVERHPGTALAPKAHIISPRTVEAFAPYRFEHEVYETGSPVGNFAKTRWFTSFGGDDVGDQLNYHTIDSWSGGHLLEHYAPLTAYRHGNFQQNRLEPTLRKHVDARRPGRALFHHELVRFVQDAEGVTATILDRDSGEEYAVRCKYMVGADGGKIVGKALGIEMVGMPPVANAYSIHFDGDLSSYLTEDDSVIKMITRPTREGGWVTGGLLVMGPERWDRYATEWLLSTILPPEGWADGDPDDDAKLQLVRDVMKIPDLEVEIRNANHWLIESIVAERYREGRVFLIGDAAHRHSPMGGLGLNTGIQDAENLAWKLQQVLGGRADDALLDSYDTERRPVAQANVDFATACFFGHLGCSQGFGLFPGAPPEFTGAVIDALWSETPEGEMRRARMAEYFKTIRWEFECADVELGFHYGDSPAVLPDGTEPPPRDPTGHEYVQVARPGHRMPHAWVERGGERTHTHALVQPGRFLLLAGPDGRAWVEAGAAAAAGRGLALDAFVVGGAEADVADVDGAWAQLRGHEDDGAVLVRPDGHVAMRARSGVDDARAALEAALDVALGLQGAGPAHGARPVGSARD